jgi:translation initiation factor IF-3
LNRPFRPRFSSFVSPGPRINGKIRAREVRVIGGDGQQLGVLSLAEALTLARRQGVDLVEVSANADPPVCRLVDYGKYRYEQNKKDKESKKHQHATRVKEIQLTATIDPHDLGVKFSHAVEFLCEDLKVKIALRFRGREMAHTEYGFQVVNKFVADLAPWGHPDAAPKLIGRGLNVMISPLPRNKRAKPPKPLETTGATPPAKLRPMPAQPVKPAAGSDSRTVPLSSEGAPGAGGFGHTPFANLDIKTGTGGE